MIDCGLSRLPACLFLSVAALCRGQQGLWLDVPFVRQEKNGCGAASIAMVMQYWDREQGHSRAVDAKAIQRLLHSPHARGIYASDLERYLRAQGFGAFAMKGQWTDLEEHLRKGRPLIVALKSGRDDRHYVVVAGIDPHRELVLMNDPAVRKLAPQHRANFEKDWKGAGNWMLLAVPGAQRPPPSP